MEKKSYTLAEIAQLVSAKLIGNGDTLISNVNTLEEASSSELSFLANERYIDAMMQSLAGAICVGTSTATIAEKNYLVSDDPSRTFQMVAELFINKREMSGFEGVHPSAIIHPSAQIGPNVKIGPLSVVDKNAKIEANTVIHSLVYIGPNVFIGKECLIFSNVTLREGTIIKDRVILQPGVVIGSCGFGYTSDETGNFKKLEQMGNVIIEEDVEIGANTTIDRARFKSTKIGKGTKIDNLVQIAHNVEIGPNNGIAAQTGIAGSSKTGKNILMGGQVGITGHVEICDYVMLATRSGVSKSLKSPGKYRGSPAISLSQYNREQVQIRKLEEYANKIKELTSRLEKLEKEFNLK